VQSLEQFDGIVRFKLANALGYRLRLELFEDFLAYGVVDLVQRREVEISARQLDQPDTIVRIECCDQIAKVSLVELGDHLAQEWRLTSLDGARDLGDEFRADCCLFPPKRETVEQCRSGRWGNVEMFGHDAPRRFV